MPSAACIIYDTPIAVREKLLEIFGLSKDVFVKAAQIGFVERANASPFDPVTAPGTDAWRYPVRSLRGDLEALGWRSDDPKNLPLSINDKLKVNITVSSGNSATGVSQKDPKSKNPKGALFEAAIERNLRQGDLFPDLLPESVAKFSKTITYPTWVFQLYITDDEIRAEVSLPESLDDRDHIGGFKVRIIIDVPPPDGAVKDIPDEDEGGDILPVVTSKI